MALNLAVELNYLIEHLVAANSPLIDNVRKCYKPEYFADLVSFWKRLDTQAHELTQLRLSIQQLSSLLLHASGTPNASSFQTEYPVFIFDIQPCAEHYFATVQGPEAKPEVKETVPVEKKMVKTQKRNRKTKKNETPTS